MVECKLIILKLFWKCLMWFYLSVWLLMSKNNSNYVTSSFGYHVSITCWMLFVLLSLVISSDYSNFMWGPWYVSFSIFFFFEFELLNWYAVIISNGWHFWYSLLVFLVKFSAIVDEFDVAYLLWDLCCFSFIILADGANI